MQRGCAHSSARVSPTAALARLTGQAEKTLREKRRALGVLPVYKRVDTCAAEFATSTAYLYSTYEEECEAHPTDRKKIMILGGGPNRIGQGIGSTTAACTLRWCCARMVTRPSWSNCNPETVSTDYDTSDRLCTSSR